jgi:hypothetical protein
MTSADGCQCKSTLHVGFGNTIDALEGRKSGVKLALARSAVQAGRLPLKLGHAPGSDEAVVVNALPPSDLQSP